VERLPDLLRALADHFLSGKARAGTEPMTAAFPPIHARPDATAVRALLAAAGLPVADLADAPLADFLGCGAGEDLAGAIGLETYGSVALLRSLAVTLDWQGRGLGFALLAHAEWAARQRGIAALYLLTTTAEAFFVRRGYVRIPRAAGGIRPPAGEGRLTRHWPRYGRGARPGPMGRCAGHTDAPA
jgi:amino-acid N-acetyltransferase